MGVALRGDVLPKGDAVSGGEFETAGAKRWTYEGKRGKVVMPYWSIPESALDDPDELAG